MNFESLPIKCVKFGLELIPLKFFSLRAKELIDFDSVFQLE